MITAGQLITDSLQVLGAIGIEETPQGATQNQALRIFNQLLEKLSSDDAFIFTKIFRTFPLVSGKHIYTWGDDKTADWNAARPLSIYDGNIRWTNTNPYPVDYQMTQLSTAQYQAIAVKDIQSTFPNQFYVEWDYPLIKVFFYPVPIEPTVSVTFSVSSLIDGGFKLTDTLPFPQGYNHYLRYKLAAELAPMYGMELPQTAYATLMQSERQLLNANAINKKPYLLNNRTNTRGNIWNGGYT